MIKIAGKVFDISQLINEYDNQSVERELLKAMSASEEVYSYDTLEQLNFELKLRREIIKAAIELNQSRFGFAIFHDSRCNTKYWKKTNNGGFNLKSGVKASDAIRDIYINGREYATECATAMEIVYYKAMLEVMGDDSFNQLFNSIYLMNWDVREPLLREIGRPKKEKDMLLGDRAYFKNPQVNPETPQWQGENVIILPNERYYGHGIGIRTADEIIDSLNNNRRSGSTQTAYLMDTVARPNFKKISDAYNRVRSRNAQTSLVWNSFPRAQF